MLQINVTEIDHDKRLVINRKWFIPFDYLVLGRVGAPNELWNSWK